MKNIYYSSDDFNDEYKFEIIYTSPSGERKVHREVTTTSKSLGALTVHQSR